MVDVLGSDHAPHTLEEKAKPYPESPSGMTGVQTLVPIMLDHVNAGRLSLQRFVDLTSAGPQRLFGIVGKGRIAAGYDADFTIVDLKRRETIRNSWIASRSQWTPYDGKTVTGWPVGTIVRGRRVMWEGELTAPSTGEAVRFTADEVNNIDILLYRMSSRAEATRESATSRWNLSKRTCRRRTVALGQPVRSRPSGEPSPAS